MKSSSSVGNSKILCTSSTRLMSSDTSSRAVASPVESSAPGVDRSSSERKESGVKSGGESGAGVGCSSSERKESGEGE